jgi:site-specific recombinase XerD
MASFNIELNQRKNKGTNEFRLRLRITINKKHSRLNLLYSVNPKHFNSNGKKSNYIRSSHPQHKIINNYIDDKIQQAKIIISDLEKDNKIVTSTIVKGLLSTPKTIDFVKFMEEEILRTKNNKKIGSSKKYTAILRSIQEYHNADTITFHEITPEYLSRYENWLIDNGKSQVTIHGYVKKIRAIFNRAIQNGLIDYNLSPFRVYKLKNGTSTKDRLNLEEIVKIEKMELKPGTLISHVRNVFLFSFYNAGIRISDLLTLTWGNIHNGRLAYTMYKTNRNHSLLLKDKPLSILNQYRTDDIQKDDYIFPFFKSNVDYSDPLFLHNQIGSKTALINKYLKQIATKAEIDKNVTTHTARHSFADIARKKEKNIYNLSKALGHSSIKVTESYLATFDEAAVDETLNNVFD